MALMNTFITKDDAWGIRQAVRRLWERNSDVRLFGGYSHEVLPSQIHEIYFNAFFNQQVPEVWRETLATVKRHAEDIQVLAKHYNLTRLIYFTRNGQINSGYLNPQFVGEIISKKLALPTYLEIEKEKQRWQSHPKYRKEKGFSSPIEEELIQIKIHR